MSIRYHRIYGPPGTGKTTRLAALVAEAVEQGTNPARILLSSFSRQAIHELRTKVGSVLGARLPAMPYARTLHSLGFLLQRFTFHKTVDGPFSRPFHEGRGGLFRPQGDKTLGHIDGEPGQRALMMWDKARARRISFDQQFHASLREDAFALDLAEAETVVADWLQWKHDHQFHDFSDMLDLPPATPGLPLAIDLAVIDEAQDLTPAMWTFLQRVIPDRCTVILAGDDDQAVYDHAGADGKYFRELHATREEVLGQSYRVPHLVKEEAESVLRWINERKAKRWASRHESGEVLRVGVTDDIPYLDQGTHLLLVRSQRQTIQFMRQCRNAGVAYRLLNDSASHRQPQFNAVRTFNKLQKDHRVERRQIEELNEWLPEPLGDDALSHLPVQPKWADLFSDERWTGLREQPWYDVLTLTDEDRMYGRALIRTGEFAWKHEERIRITTMHRAKGAEADHVALLCVYPERVRHFLQGATAADRDAERRVWYVGMTRARKTLSLHGLYPTVTW